NIAGRRFVAAIQAGSAHDAQVGKLVGDFLELVGKVRARGIPEELRLLARIIRILAEAGIRGTFLERRDLFLLVGLVRAQVKGHGHKDDVAGLCVFADLKHLLLHRLGVIGVGVVLADRRAGENAVLLGVTVVGIGGLV